MNQLEELINSLEESILNTSNALDTLSENDNRSKKDNYDIITKVIDDRIYIVDTDNMLKNLDAIRERIKLLEQDLFLTKKELELK